MSDFHSIPIITFDPGQLPVVANDNVDWALDLVTAFHVLRQIRRRVLVRWVRSHSVRDARWLRENLSDFQAIWDVLRARGYCFSE